MQEGGRKKPFLVFAEESLLGLSGKTALTIDGRKMSAMEVVTTLWLNPQGWDNKPMILVNHKPLKEAPAWILPGSCFPTGSLPPTGNS